MGCHWKKLWHILQIVLLVSFSPFFRVKGQKWDLFCVTKSHNSSKGEQQKSSLTKLIPKTPFFCCNVTKRLHHFKLILDLLHSFHFLLIKFQDIDKQIILYLIDASSLKMVINCGVLQMYLCIICAVSLCAPLDPFVIWACRVFLESPPRLLSCLLSIVFTFSSQVMKGRIVGTKAR